MGKGGDSNRGLTQSLGGSRAAETRRGSPQCTPAWSVPPPLCRYWVPAPHHLTTASSGFLL